MAAAPATIPHCVTKARWTPRAFIGHKTGAGAERRCLVLTWGRNAVLALHRAGIAGHYGLSQTN